MVAQAHVTVRNAGWLVAQRGVHVLSGVVFAIVVPRLMGPTTYGQYALLASLAAWFVLLGTLGFAQIMGRFVPQFILQGSQASLRKFLSDLLTVRLFSGTIVAALYLLVMTLWLPEMDRLLLILLTGSVLLRGVTFYFFSIFLGLNQAARWASEQVLQRWLLLILLPLGFVLGGLRGACAGLLLADFIMLVIGVWWSKPHLAWPALRVNIRALAPYLQFGAIFFGTNLLTTAVQRSGEPLVRLVSGDYSQVGYYGAAASAYHSIALAMGQLTLSFAPLFTTLQTQGNVESLRTWIKRLLKLLAVAGVMVSFGAILLANDLVSFVFGPAYRPMAANLAPFALTLLPLGLSSVASVLALTHDRPMSTLIASGLKLAVFWGLGLPLVTALGSLGASWAMLIATLAQAGYLAWRLWDVLRAAMRPWWWTLGLGALTLPLVALKSSTVTNMMVYAAFALIYCTALFALRIMTPVEIAAAWQALRSRPAHSPAGPPTPMA